MVGREGGEGKGNKREGKGSRGGEERGKGRGKEREGRGKGS